MLRKRWELGAVCMLSLATAFTSVPTFAQTTQTTQTVAASASTIDLNSYSNSTLLITSDTVLTGNISGKKIIIKGNGVKVTLNNAVINGNNNPGIVIDGSAVLTLEGTNTVTSSNYAGIRVKQGNSLTIQGSGKLTAKGGSSGAGIGSDEENQYATYGNITINSGTVFAFGGSRSAGIGGGYMNEVRDGGTQGEITINGGTVEATGTTGGAGIGGGSQCKTDNAVAVTIAGGTVKAIGSDGGAGIGGGFNGGVKFIHISNGEVTAESKSGGGAGIGGGKERGIADITISGDAHILSAKGSDGGAGIGSGSRKGGSIQKEVLTINGGIIEEAIGGADGAGIGGGNERACVINISGDALIVKAQGGSTGNTGGSGIGGGNNISTTDDDKASINITGGKIKDALGGKNACGIGGGASQSGVATITISGAVIENAQGNGEGAGIGSSKEGNAGPIIINNKAKVCAQGGQKDVSDVGAGRDRTTTHVPVTITDAEVFTGYGNIPNLTSNSNVSYYAINIFQTYETRNPFTKNKLGMYSELKPGDTKKVTGFDIEDFKYPKARAVTELVNGVSKHYTIKELHCFLPSNVADDTFKNDNGVFKNTKKDISGFWMEYVAPNGKKQIAKPVYQKDKNGKQINPKTVVFADKTHNEGKLETTRVLEVKNSNKGDINRDLIIVPVQFEEINIELETKVNDIEGEKASIIPYSVSSFKFELPTLTSDLIATEGLDASLNVDKAKIKVILKAPKGTDASNDFKFDVTKLRLEILNPDGTKNKAMQQAVEKKLKESAGNIDAANMTFSFEYPVEFLNMNKGQYTLKAYVPTEYFVDMDNAPNITEFNKNYANKKAATIQVETTIEYTLTINTEPATIQKKGVILKSTLDLPFKGFSEIH